MDVDYERYAEGEAMLGWVNATVWAKSDAVVTSAEADAALLSLCMAISRQLEESGAEIAHLKLGFVPEGSAGGGKAVGVVNQVINGEAPAVSLAFSDGVNAAEGTILVNVRAEGAPEVIRRAVEDALGSGEMVWRLELREIEAFRPGKPVPVPERRVVVG